MNSLVETLVDVDFSVYEAKLITVLLEYESPNAKQMAQVSGVPKNKVYELLERLEHNGVVESLATKPKRFRLLDLTQFLKRKEIERQITFAAAAKKVAELKPKQTSIEADRELWTTEGSFALINKINRVLQNTEKESLAFIDVWIEGSQNYKHVKEAIARGVQFKFLGPVTEEAKPTIAAYQAAGVEVREWKVDSAGYSIFDTKMVQVRVSSDKIIALWINNQYLATTLREHFFSCWRVARPVEL